LSQQVVRGVRRVDVAERVADDRGPDETGGDPMIAGPDQFDEASAGPLPLLGVQQAELQAEGVRGGRVADQPPVRGDELP